MVVVRAHQRMGDLVEDRVIQLRLARHPHVEPGQQDALLREVAGACSGTRFVKSCSPPVRTEAVQVQERPAAPQGAPLRRGMVLARTTRPDAAVGDPVLLAAIAADHGALLSERHDAPGDLTVSVREIYGVAR